MRSIVLSPGAASVDGEAGAVVAPAFDGEIGILVNHAPLMTVLGNGMLRVTSAGLTRRFHVQGGFLQVVKNSVRVLAEHVQGETGAA